MSHSSLYLTNLYNDLITNTPQTITMDIPSEVGQGQISQTKIKHGVILSDWKMCYQSDMNVQGPVSGEYMQIIFCLNDGISWGIMNENRSITIQKNESCIYAGHDGTEYICVGFNSNGTRNMSNNVRPITCIEDLKGIKMRVMNSSTYIKWMNALGANATPMGFNEVFTGLQQGTKMEPLLLILLVLTKCRNISV